MERQHLAELALTPPLALTAFPFIIYPPTLSLPYTSTHTPSLPTALSSRLATAPSSLHASTKTLASQTSTSRLSVLTATTESSFTKTR